jgi:hypothetical protein
MVPSAMILVNFGNTFCPFFYQSEIVAAHKIMDIRPLTAFGPAGYIFVTNLEFAMAHRRQAGHK